MKLDDNLRLNEMIPHALPRTVDNQPRVITGGHYGTTSLSVKRRINNDGVRMLENSLAIKHSEFKATMMENRLKHLESEEQRAQRLKMRFEKQAENIMEQR